MVFGAAADDRGAAVAQRLPRRRDRARWTSQIKDIATLRAEIEALKARQKAVEDLQTDRNVPVHLLDELVKQTPEGVYLTTIKQTGQVVAVNGVAQTNERVSEFLRNTLYNSPWLEKPELVEIKAVAATAANREQRRLFEFSMRVTLKRPQAAAAARPAPRRAPRARPAATPGKTILRCDMAMASTLNFDVSTLLGQATAQFRNLNTKRAWPVAAAAQGRGLAGRGRRRGRGRLVCPADRCHRRARRPRASRSRSCRPATATGWPRP